MNSAVMRSPIAPFDFRRYVLVVNFGLEPGGFELDELLDFYKPKLAFGKPQSIRNIQSV